MVKRFRISGSTLNIELAGVGNGLFDQILVENVAILDVSYFDDDLFTILQAGSLSGTFDSFIAPDSQNWQVQYDLDNNRVQIGVIQIGVIPESSALALLSIAFLTLLRRKK